MDLIDRFIRELGVFLPRAQRDDILRELGDAMRAEAAAREAALGRPLTSTEHRALLARYGHPLLLAARYRSPLLEKLIAVIPMFRTWDPERWLRPLEAIHRVETLHCLNQRPSVSGFVVGTMLGAWWLVGIKYPALLLFGGAEFMAFGPVVHRAYPLMVAVQLLATVHHASLVLHPQRARRLRPHSPPFLFVRALGAVVFAGFILSASHDWVVSTVTEGGNPAPVAQVNSILSMVLIGIAVLVACGTGIAVTRALLPRTLRRADV
jgi:hypothetical protein